jgi:uncharacterized protein
MVAKLLLQKQHSLTVSIALHLIPGILIVMAYNFIASPLVQSIGYPPFFGWVISMCLALAPLELGLLYYLGWEKNKKLSLKGVVSYTDKPLKGKQLFKIVTLLIILLFIASSIFLPIDNLLQKFFFPWINYVSNGADFFKGYPKHVMLISLYISFILIGVILPFIEELYFAGFLLPRISRYGKIAPVLNIVLFSVYHFWTPWQFFSRIAFYLPTVYVTWQKEDLRISIWVHCLSNSLVQLGTIIAVYYVY